MKIAIVCLNLSWQAGGVRLIYSEARALQKLGHKVVIYAPDFNPAVYPDLAKWLDIRSVPPPRPVFWQYKSRGLLKRILEKIERGRALALAAKKISETMDADFDIVNLHDFSYLLAPLYKGRNPGAKIIWTMNDPPYMYLPKSDFFYDILSRIYNALKDATERRYFRFIDAVAVLVRRNKKWAEERGMRAEVVWSGLEFEKFYAPVKPPKSGRDRWNLLCVGALNRYRRFEDAISAAKILKDKGYDIFLTVVCKNIWKEDEYRKELQELVERGGMGGATRLMFGGATDEELRKIYAESDIFILPIHLPPPRDGFGWQLVIFEAMAAGLPSAVSKKNDVVEAVGVGDRAVLVEPMSPSSIAEETEKLISDKDFYRKIAENGQNFARGMTWERYARAILDLSGNVKM